jgi:hypothetical protein
MSGYAPAARRAEAETKPSRPSARPASSAGMPRFLQRQEPAAGQLELGNADSPLEAAARRGAGAGASDGGGSNTPGGAAGGGSALPPRAAGLVRRATGGAGVPLPRHLRREFETRVGADLSAVRVHTDSPAAMAARALGAKAFTVGQHVAFAPGRYAPGTAAGRRLLGHELSHTAQHRRGAAPAAPEQRDPDERPPQSSLAIGLWGMTFTPQGEATYRAGDRGVQVIAVALRRLIGEAYQPGLERHFYSAYRRRHGDPVLSGRLAGEDAGDAMVEFTIRAQPAFALVRWLDDGGAGDVYVALTDEQRDLLALAVGADQAWTALLEAARQLDLAIPAWFSQSIFAAEIASRRRLLREFMTAQDRYEQQPSAATREARLEAAAEIFRSIQNGVLILEAIREDASLLPEPNSRDAALVHIAYISIWPATPESSSREFAGVMLRSAIAAPRDPANGLSAARFLTYLRTQPALTREALSSSEARRELLLRYAHFIERSFSLPGQTGDQQLSDDPARLASDPPHEAHLSSYPQLQPPFFDAATGTGHKFSMSIHFPTVFDAFATYSYRFDRIRVPDDEFVGAVNESTPGDAPSWGEVYAADMVMASRYLAADVRRGIDRFGQEWGPPGQALGAAVLVGAMRYVGTSISTLLKILTEPRWEATFVFPEDGLYVVRCNAVRHNREEAEVTRPPSVAYLPVLARHPREMAERRVQAAQSAAERERQRLWELQELLAQPVTWIDQEVLEAEYAALSASHGDVEDLYGYQRREIARQLVELEAQIIAPYDRSDSRARTLLRIHPLADRAAQLRRQLEQIDNILDTRRRRWTEHGITTIAERLTASFVSDQGQVVNLVLEAVDRTPDGVSQPKTYYVADATTPSGGDEQATADTRAAAILEALVTMLEEGDGYGRGELVVLIDGQTWHRRIEAGSTKLLMEAVEHLATIASIAAIAAAPFTGGSSLYLLIPIGIIGAIPSAYRIARRVEDETFRWDLQMVMDFVNIVSAAVGVGQVGAAAWVVWLGRSLMVTGFGLDGLNMVLLGAQVIEQIDATRGLPEGERAARISQILGGALFQLGITAAGSLASRRYQQQAEAGRAPDVDVSEPRSAADVDVGPRSTMAGAGWETLPAPPARRAAPDLPPPTDPNSPEHLFALLEGGVEPTLPPSGRAPTPAARPRSRSTIQRGITSPHEAYRIYNETLAVADGREVAIYYNRNSNEYMVRIGSETDVAAYGAGWVTLVHFHPNPTEGLTFRLPAPADFEGLLQRALSGPVREFVEFDIPGVGRGRTEFGIDLDAADPIFIRISHPGGEQQVIRFRDTGDYTSYWGERTVYVEPGSPTHQQMLDNIGAWIRERRGGDVPDPSTPGAGSTMAGLRAWIRARRGRRHSERLRRAGAALPEGPIADEQMLGFLRQADQHPLRQQMRELAELQGDHPGPGSPLTMEHVSSLLEAFRAETGMRVVVTAEASGVNLRPGEGGSTEGQIRIEPGIRDRPEVLFAELSHDINAYLASRTQRLPLRDMPELASVPDRGAINLRDYFHAGRILDYATFRRLSVDEAIAEIRAEPFEALMRLQGWIQRVERGGP